MRVGFYAVLLSLLPLSVFAQSYDPSYTRETTYGATPNQDPTRYPALYREPHFKRYPNAYDGDTTPGTPQLPEDLELTVAVGIAAKPEYLGSGDYEAVFDPAVDFEYDQRAFLVINRQAMMAPYEGLGYKILANNDWSFGVNLTYDTGRDNDNDFIQGLPEVDWTVLGGGFAAWHPGPMFARANVGYDLAGEFSSYKGELGLGIAGPLSPAFRGMLELSAAFAGDNFFDSYFGVTTGQSLATAGRLAPYEAKGGFYKAGLGGTLRYQMPQGAFVQAVGRFDRLIGDAKDSPVSEKDTQLYVSGQVGYRF